MWLPFFSNPSASCCGLVRRLSSNGDFDRIETESHTSSGFRQRAPRGSRANDAQDILQLIYQILESNLHIRWRRQLNEFGVGSGVSTGMSNVRDPIYHRYRCPTEIISHAVWLYFGFPLSLRMVEEMLAARGICVTYETGRQWATTIAVGAAPFFAIVAGSPALIASEMYS
jgi:hypothetical protein